MTSWDEAPPSAFLCGSSHVEMEILKVFRSKIFKQFIRETTMWTSCAQETAQDNNIILLNRFRGEVHSEENGDDDNANDNGGDGHIQSHFS